MDVHDRLRDFWDLDADTYDHSPGHAVADPAEAAAWQAAMLAALPPPPARILDAGAGTGAMSVLAAELGYEVTALDLSPEMLSKLQAKARARALPIETVVSPADRPPTGPFDAVMERHLIWTVPDPVATLAAWRAVAPRAVLFEGRWGRRGPWQSVRHAAAGVAKRAYGIGDDHHAAYEDDLRASLPLAGGMSVRPLLEAAANAGWRRYRVDRMADVEAARRRSTPWPLGTLESIPRFALVLDR
jgi:SAM-dependent methyltransferase